MNKQERNAIQDKQRGMVQTLNNIRYAIENEADKKREFQTLKLQEKAVAYLAWLKEHGINQAELDVSKFMNNDVVNVIVTTDRSSLDKWVDTCLAAVNMQNELHWHIEYLWSIITLPDDLINPDERKQVADFLALEDNNIYIKNMQATFKEMLASRGH